MVLDFGLSTLSIALYAKERSRFRCIDRIPLPLSWDTVVADPNSAGSEIADLLRTKGWSAREVVVGVARRHLVCKPASVPKDGLADLGEIVHLQAQNLFPVPMKQLEIDFVEHARQGSKAQVLIAGLAIKNLNAIQTLVSAAKLKILSIGSAELGIPNLSIPKEDSLSLDLLLNSNSSELVLSDRTIPLVTYSLPYIPSESDRDCLESIGEVVSAIQKLRENHEFIPSQREIQDLRVWGRLPKIGLSLLKEGLSLSVSNELTETTSVQEMAEIRELAILKSQLQSQRIDFANPRIPRDTAREARVKIAFYAALAAIIILVSAIPIWREHATLDSHISQVRERRTTLEERLVRFQSIATQWEKWHRFEGSRKDFAVELQELLNLLPERELFFLESIDVQPVMNDSNLVVRLRGGSQSREVVQGLINTLLAKNENFRVRLPAVDAFRKDVQYPFRFSIEVEIVSKETLESSPSDNLVSSWKVSKN